MNIDLINGSGPWPGGDDSGHLVVLQVPLRWWYLAPRTLSLAFPKLPLEVEGWGQVGDRLTGLQFKSPPLSRLWAPCCQCAPSSPGFLVSPWP